MDTSQRSFALRLHQRRQDPVLLLVLINRTLHPIQPNSILFQLTIHPIHLLFNLMVGGLGPLQRSLRFSVVLLEHAKVLLFYGQLLVDTVLLVTDLFNFSL